MTNCCWICGKAVGKHRATVNSGSEPLAICQKCDALLAAMRDGNARHLRRRLYITGARQKKGEK